jgi:hypothetical protein
MKIFTLCYRLFASFLFAVILLTISAVKAQTITIDSTFTTNYEIFPFENIEQISDLTIEGDVELNNDTSLVIVMKPAFWKCLTPILLSFR